MKKKLLLGIALLSVSLPTLAGGLLTNTNQHILFLRLLARDASTRIDAVYSNPAGTAFMPNGFHFSLNNQSAFQTRTINSQFPLFMHNNGSQNKEYVGKASAAFVPSLFAVYKKDKWAFSTSFALTGGGGKAVFNDGLPSFEAKVASIIPTINSIEALKKFGVNRYAIDSYMEGQQYIFGWQLGASYKITDYLSVFGGARLNYVNNKYKGHLKNLRLGLGNNPTLISGSQLLDQALAGLQQQGVQVPAEMIAKFKNAVSDKVLEVEQTGWGVTPIVGADFKYNKLNIGVKYELLTSLNVVNKTVKDDTNNFKEGVNTPHDIPSLLTIGAEYEILPTLRASAGYHHYFDKSAKMAEVTAENGIKVGKQNFIKGGTNEYLAGVEWDVCKWAQLSAGTQFTRYNVGNEYQQDISFAVSSYSIGFGAGIKISPKLTFNIAYMLTNYENFEKASNFKLGAASIPMKETFTRTSKVFGVGVDYSF